jgi:hypothetical protein
MAEIAKQDEVPGAEIVDLMEYARRRETPPATAAELEEYRRYWPLMMQMLREWELVKGSGGCPIARRITTQD